MMQNKIHPSALKIAIVFLVIGVLWITLSDELVLLFATDVKVLSTIQTLKGWFFIVVTSFVVFLLVNKVIGQKENLINTINAESEWQKLLISRLPDTRVFLLDPKFNLILRYSDELKKRLNKILNIELKAPDNYCAHGSKPTVVQNLLSEVLRGDTTQLAVNTGGQLFEIHGIPVKNDKGIVISILLISFNRTSQHNLLKILSAEKENYAKLSEKYHTLNNELADSYKQLKTYNVELIENKERYSAFIQQTSEAVFRFDLKKSVDLSLPVNMQVAAVMSTAYLAEYNPSFGQIYEFERKRNYIGKSYKEISPAENEVQVLNLITELAQHEYVLKNHESIEYDSRGQTRYFLNNIVGIIVDNKLVRFWGTKLETTNQKKYERELIESKKKAEQSDKLKTAFLANMSHEIRTPLNGILGFSELICKPGINDKKRERYFNIIQTSNQQLLRIINDILDISRIQTGQLSIFKTNFSLNGLLEDIEASIMPAIKEKPQPVQIEIQKAFKDGEDIIRSDRERLYQVITNLANNAIKFTDKGLVTIGYEKKSKSVLEFSITDSGIGIPSEYLGSIFDQFRQVEEFASRNYGGTGLGLSISKGLVELLGGYIAVESEENVGSTFRFTMKYS